MTERTYNFYSGPAALPTEVLEKAASEMLSLRDSGMSVMEISHRSADFVDILDSARSRLRSLLRLPDDFHVLFLQGGASLQFSMVPMNFLSGRTAAYVSNGTWGRKAAQAAAGFGTVRVFEPKSESGLRVPSQDEIEIPDDAAYVHYVSNETIDGVEFPYDLDGFGVPVVCDASSNILSRPIDVEKYSLIYAGAQKNIGPSGVTVVIVRDEFLRSAPAMQAGVLGYSAFADNGSMPNTPNTWGIYMIDLVCEWLEGQGGVEGIAARNGEKSRQLYSAIDGSDGFYTGVAAPGSRSRMNVTFRLASEALEEEFCAEAMSRGMAGLRGHRSVGGIRASIYNAMPVAGVERLAEFMADFARRKA
jgi:phosphoserine aminotransferase